MPGTVATPCEFDLSDVEAAVGRVSFERGRTYAQRGRVVRVPWDPDGAKLIGSVVGDGALYETVAFFGGGRGRARWFDGGECTCPVGSNCKHVAAIAVAAANGRAARAPAPRRGRAAAGVEPAAWERPLRALLEARVAHTVGSPLALELSLARPGRSAGAAPRLMARPMRPGARGGWVKGSLTWSAFDPWYGYGGDHRPDHVVLLRELHAAQRARRDRGGYYYSSADRTLDLTDCGPQLWSLLDQAVRIGLPLLHGGKGMGELPAYRRGEVALDVTRQDDEHARLRAVLRIDGDPADVEPVLFLGSEGHGVVCAERTAARDRSGDRLLLVRLARPVETALQRMVLDGRPLAIPGGGLERFAAELCPGLGRVATVVSSDGSFEPPEVSAPALVLRARYGDRHSVELGWEWAYRVGADERRVPLAPDGGGMGFRDLDAERAALADASFAETGLERFGLLDDRGRPADGPTVALIGLESMRFTTEQLPRRRDLPAVTVELEGTPPDYRDVADSLEIAISTADVVGERDWFDLGVSIRVDGRELPFADVFAALATGACCWPTAPISPCAWSVCSRCERSSRRRAHWPSRRRAPCASAATRRGCGPSSPRSASFASRRRLGSARSARCSSSTPSPSPLPRPRWPLSCAPISSTASAGWPRSGTWSSAGSSPTTWGSARRFRPWP